MGHSHLTDDERNDIYLLKAQGLSLRAIATSLGRDKSTISRELSRNSGLRGYRPRQAHQKALARRSLRRGGRVISEEVWNACRQLIEVGYSPQQAAGRVQKIGFDAISHEYIYRRIYATKIFGDLLWRQLRCQKKRRKRYGSGRTRRGRIPNRRGIEYRSANVERRAIVGHWEGDTVIGRNHKSAIVTLVERKSGFSLAAKVASKDAGEVAATIIRLLKPYKAVVRTITFDNGLEFARHAEVSQAIGCKIYFADPYSSWQRGSNENFNGLLRQRHPKKSCFRDLCPSYLQQSVDLINHRARRRLDWSTPHEIFRA
ncbi:MAG: IS30 family transposase, partial [Cytophagaceae bacterium]